MGPKALKHSTIWLGAEITEWTAAVEGITIKQIFFFLPFVLSEQL